MRYLATVAALAALPLALAPAAAQVAPPILPDATILDVSATGKTSRVPDIATIRAGVVTQSVNAAGALSENAQRMARVIAALKAAGIADRDLSTASVALSPQYRYQDNQPPVITGYQASNSVSVTFRDIKKSGAVLDALVKEGANQIDGPNMAIDKPDAALDEARTDAIARARARAELYAKAAGLHVDRIVSISEAGENPGSPPMPVRFMARVAAAPVADTQVLPGETDVTASVNVRFLLK
jgi:uncharacterized protein